MRHLAMAAITLLGLSVAGGALTTAGAASQTPAEPEAAGIIVKFHAGTTLAEVGVARDDAQAAPARSTKLEDVALLDPRPDDRCRGRGAGGQPRRGVRRA